MGIKGLSTQRQDAALLSQLSAMLNMLELFTNSKCDHCLGYCKARRYSKKIAVTRKTAVVCRKTTGSVVMKLDLNLPLATCAPPRNKESPFQEALTGAEWKSGESPSTR